METGLNDFCEIVANQSKIQKTLHRSLTTHDINNRLRVIQGRGNNGNSKHELMSKLGLG